MQKLFSCSALLAPVVGVKWHSFCDESEFELQKLFIYFINSHSLHKYAYFSPLNNCVFFIL